MPIQSTPEDEGREHDVCAALAASWDCEVWRTPLLAVWDFVAGRDGVVRAIGEIKCRTVSSDTYKTAFIAYEKWQELRAETARLHVPAFFVIQWTDRITYSDASEIDGSMPEVRGRTDRPEMPNDLEYIIEHPVTEMKGLT